MKMLSDQEKQGLAALSHQQLAKLLALIREAKAMFGSGVMPRSAIQAMTDVVDDKLAREIVSDLRSGVGEPGGFLGPEKTVPKERGSGWQKPTEMGSPPGIKYIDQMCDVQDAMDRIERGKGFGLAGLSGPKVMTKDREG
jgi:hypothetical protein